MRISVGHFVGALLMFCCVSVSFGSDVQTIQNAIATKFGQSSKGVLKSVELKASDIKVVASKGGIGDERDIVIDTAVALNRVNNNISNWKNVSVSVDNRIFSFKREDFDNFRSGKINDQQFLKRLDGK
ncbi:hypothetical protein [Thiobacillus sedimenti]|uniref:Uncharacterized protein n=1 Tax=Thiobacillus sedimenti TaxID=3110231 RepID=A0ABZ1CI34_9PROT|nr:hypothetical protein [Thiobacillus sp. SCUT-2]WRS38886.1 hypothetical protein VA613_12885 [Thiobacillus sp. SCUT-2]